jgi:hypothetical protein
MNGREQENLHAQKIQSALDHNLIDPDLISSLILTDEAFSFLCVTVSFRHCYCMQEGHDKRKN